jgi:hypothetical protein
MLWGVVAMRQYIRLMQRAGRICLPLTLALAMGLSACGGGSPAAVPAAALSPASAASDLAAADAPVMAISASAYLSPYPTSAQDYALRAQQAFLTAYQAGARGQMSTWTWKALEPGPGASDVDRAEAARKWADLDGALGLSRDFGMRQYLGIQLINTTRLELPADLAGEPLDSDRMVQRFNALLDNLLGTRKGSIRYLSIGNEVDAWMRAHPDDWARYERFLNRVIAHVRALDPAILVGTTITADGLLGASPIEASRLARLGDVWMLTYYPLSWGASGVGVRDPSVVAADFQRLREMAGAQPIVYQEVGYPASARIGSSEALQARFMGAVLDAWHADHDRIPFLNFFLLHDFTPQMCDDFGVYYAAVGVSGFTDFLCTLGLRKATGEPRQAWTALTARTSATGWQP